MASSSQQDRQREEVTFGATINDTPTKTQNHLAPNVFDTPKSLSPVVTQDSPSTPDGPLTPFYDVAPSAQASVRSLPAAAASNADLESAQKEGYFVSTNALNSEVNLPSDLTPISAMTTQHKMSIDGRAKECKMWPTKQTLRDMDKKERAKRRAARACGCNSINAWWSNMTKKQRLWFKILIALFFVGAAVGLAIGISCAVHGGVFAGKGQTKQIPDA